MKKTIIAIVAFAITGCLNNIQSQDTIRGKDSAFFYGHLNWYDLDTLHQWRSTVDDSYGFSISEVYDSILLGNERYWRDVIVPSWTSPEYADHNPQNDYHNPPERLRYGNTIIGNQMETDRPIKIIGIAACGYMQRPADTTTYLDNGSGWIYDIWLHNREWNMLFSNTRDVSTEGRITDSLILYKPTSTGTPEKLASGMWRVEWPHREIVLPLEDSSLRCAWRSPPTCPLNDPVHYDSTPTVALYEVYFEKPVVVTDSFIVAGTAFNNEMSYGLEGPPNALNITYYRWMWLWDHCPTRYWNLFRAPADQPGTPPGLPPWRWGQPRWIKYRNERWGRLSYYSNARIIFPIIEPDYEPCQPCEPIENMRVAGISDTTTTLMWDATNSVRWEVKYGIVGLSEEDYQIVPTAVPTVTLTGLRQGMQYKAYVRGWCDCDSSYSEWSDSLLFSIAQHESVERPGVAGRYTLLMPNPAREKVSVVSSYKISHIELYALDGRKVLEQEVDGISSVVDVSGLPSGTYIAAVYLPHGVATKKLLVEK